MEGLLINTYETTWFHNPEDCNQHIFYEPGNSKLILYIYNKISFIIDHQNYYTIFAWICGYFWNVSWFGEIITFMIIKFVMEYNDDDIYIIPLWIVNKASLYMWFLISNLLDKYNVEREVKV